MDSVNEKIDKYLMKESVDNNNAVEKLLSFVLGLPINKLTPEQSAELSNIIDGIVGKDEENDLELRIKKSKILMLLNRYKRTSLGKRLVRRASRAEVE